MTAGAAQRGDTPPLAFLTGATGFIGGRLAARLAASGWRLRCLVRNRDRAERLLTLGAELVLGDVTDGRALLAGCDGADAGLHMAAVYRLGPVRAREQYPINVGATRAFLSALEQQGVARAIYVSTTGFFRPAQPGAPPPDPVAAARYDGPYPTRYQATKAEAHRLAVEKQEAGSPVIIVSPAFVYGPGDEGPAGQLVRALLRGRVPALATEPGVFSFVHVDDVVAGLVAALARGRPGAHYVLGGEVDSLNGFAHRVAREAGVRAPLLELPVALLAATGSLLDIAARVSGRELMISRESVLITARNRMLVDEGPTRRALGYAPRGLDRGIAETLDVMLNRT